MNIPKISGAVVVSILATGALLNLAASGMFGQSVQKAANFVTKGYGV